MKGAQIPAADGHVYGVRCNDGSVIHHWSGSTQREQAVVELRACRALYPGDAFALVRRFPGEMAWTEVPG